MGSAANTQEALFQRRGERRGTVEEDISSFAVGWSEHRSWLGRPSHADHKLRWAIINVFD